MAVVRFAEYRMYEDARVEVSNAMMGLLAGAQMAAHMLQLTEGSDRMLPEIFPRIPHIGRFNLRTGDARAILHSADTHLGAMAVPYALAIHEDHLRTCAELLERAGALPAGKAKTVRLYKLHATLATATGGSFATVGMEQFDVLRMMRNCVIHNGGRVQAELAKRLLTWSRAAARGWHKLAQRSPGQLQIGDVVELGHGELLVALAVTKSLTKEANEMLQPALPRDLWADLAVDDLIDHGPGVPVDITGRLRKLRGYARHFYTPLILTDEELARALGRRGFDAY